MFRGHSILLSLAAVLLLAASATAGTLTSGTVLDPGGGWVVGHVGAIRKSTVDAAPLGVGVFPEEVAMIGRSQYRLIIDDSDPTWNEFYVFTMTPAYHDQVHDGVLTSFSHPLPSDFRAPGVSVFDGRQANPDTDFVLTSNRVTRRVLMRDGVTELSTDIYLASPLSVPAPTVLERTPYNKRRLVWRNDYTVDGYNVVIQDMRGRFASDGDDRVFSDDAWGDNQDGYDTIEWVADQSWSDGNVGMIGASAPAMVQYLAAGAFPPSLKCGITVVGTGNLYEGLIFTGGIFRKKMIEQWLSNQGNSDYLPVIEAHPNRDHYWDGLTIRSRLDRIQVPFLHVGGWFDIMSESALMHFKDLQENGGPGARGWQKLVMGPWSHWGLFASKQGQLTYPPNASWSVTRVRDMELEFFDYWLKGLDNGLYDQPAVQYYRLGDVDKPKSKGNNWVTAEEWPPVSHPTRLYLWSDGSLKGTPERTHGAAVSYVYDPQNPAPTIGGSNLYLPQGPHDQRPNEARPDVLTFTSEPLTRSTEVTGKMRAVLYVDSTALDTDFLVKVCDVYPDGRSMMMQEGAIRARHRLGNREEHLLTPGHVHRLEIDLWSISLVFRKTHQIRIEVTSSSDPRLDPNPNTGEPFRSSPATVTALNTVHTGWPHASYVVLPVIFSD